MSGRLLPENCLKIQEVKNTEKGKRGILFCKHVEDLTVPGDFDEGEKNITVRLLACSTCSVCSSEEISNCKALKEAVENVPSFLDEILTFRLNQP